MNVCIVTATECDGHYNLNVSVQLDMALVVAAAVLQYAILSGVELQDILALQEDVEFIPGSRKRVPPPVVYRNHG